MACQAVLTDARSLAIDLSGVQFADATGVALLHGLERRGARLERSSEFVDALLRDGARPGARPQPASIADGALVERLRAGDPAAFETLVREQGGRMLATARRFVRTDDDARDVVQDAFQAAFRSIEGFVGASRLSTWLHRIVVNAALMRLRSQQRRREDSIEDLLPRFEDDGRWAEPAARWDGKADALLERWETRAMVRSAIDRLPESYRTVLLLRDIEELDTDETASILDVTPNAVKTRLHRARQALRTLIERDRMHETDCAELPGRPA
jgi:RNA polymerase sigma-70 factor (ECF subfamily)